MKSKSHFIISVAKSIIRIVSCILLVTNGSIVLFSVGFIGAELLGIAEEIWDKRE